MLRDPQIPDGCRGRNTAGPPAMASGHVAAGSKQGVLAQPVPSRNGAVPTQRLLVLGREPCGRRETETRIDMASRHAK